MSGAGGERDVGPIWADLTPLHADTGATSVYATHDQVGALSLSDYIAGMSAGRLEQYGTPTEIHRTPATKFVVEPLDNAADIMLRIGEEAHLRTPPVQPLEQ